MKEDRKSARTAGFPVWLRLAVCFGLLAVLYSRVDPAKLYEAWRQATLPGVVLAVLFLLLAHCNSAFRWHLLLRCLDAGVRLRRVFHVSFISLFLGMFTPGTVGLEIARIVGLTRSKVTATNAVLSTALDRVLGALALAIMVIIGIAIAPRHVGAATGGAAGMFALAILACVAAATNSRLRRWAFSLLPPRLATVAGKRLQKAVDGVEAFRSRPAVILAAFGLCMLTQLLRIGMVASATWALNIPLPLPILLVAVPLVSFVSQLPLTFGGLGVRDVGYAYFLTAAGHATEQALALSLLLYLVLCLSVLPGAWLWLIRRKKPSAPGHDNELLEESRVSS